MRRTVYYGYNDDGIFAIRIVEQTPHQTAEFITLLTRSECNKISKHMQSGKKGEERVVETINGQEVKR